MSAFLGPIHARMYGKVQQVNGLADAIAAYADEQGWTSGLLTQLRESLPAPTGNLEQVIDLSQIHASLGGLVDQAERRLAFAVSHAAQEDPDRMQALCVFAEQQGAQNAPQSVDTCVAAWQTMDTSWLDGMPCDGGVQFLQTEPDEVVWSVHGDHPAPGYWNLRVHWMQGFCSRLGLQLEQLNENTFRLTKEG